MTDIKQIRELLFTFGTVDLLSVVIRSKQTTIGHFGKSNWVNLLVSRYLCGFNCPITHWPGTMETAG